MTSPRNTPRFGRWTSGETPPFSDAGDYGGTIPPSLDAIDDAFLDEWTGERYPPKRTLKIRVRDWFKHIADGYAVDEEDEDE